MRNTRSKKSPAVKDESNKKGVTSGRAKKASELYPFKTLLPNCKIFYNRLQPHIIRVTKQGGAITCHYPSRGVKKKGNTFGCTIRGESLNLHKLVYQVEHDIKKITSQKEVYHICGDPLCCKPSHLVLGDDGDNSKVHGCRGYIKLDELDPTGSKIFFRVCKHDTPCCVVTTLENLEENPKNRNYPSAIKYKDKVHILVKNRKSYNVTEIKDDDIFTKEEIDENYDEFIENLIMPVETYLSTYNINNLPPIDNEYEYESDDDDDDGDDGDESNDNIHTLLDDGDKTIKTRSKNAPIIKGVYNPNAILRKSSKKEKEKPTFLEECKRVYNLLKPSIVHITKYQDSDVICSYPSQGANLYNDNAFTYRILSKTVTLPKIIYHAVHDIETIPSDNEIYHQCGDGLCCRPSHLKVGPRGESSKRHGCKGFIKLDIFDSENEPYYVRVCVHKPPCFISTNLKDLKCIDCPGTKKHSDCPGSLKYKDKLYSLCKKGCCANVIDFTYDMVCGWECVDNENDDDIDNDDSTMHIKEYLRRFNPSKLAPIENESGSDKRTKSTKRPRNDSDDSDA